MDYQQEYQKEIEARNFTRAAMLAEEGSLGNEALDQARAAAFKQTVGEWFNFRGAQVLASSWAFSRDRVAELCNEVIADLDSRAGQVKRVDEVFDIDAMSHTKVHQLIRLFRDRYR
jgi:hypothetical protein